MHTTFSCISLDAADEVYLLAAKWKEEFPYRSFGVMETFVKWTCNLNSTLVLVFNRDSLDKYQGLHRKFKNTEEENHVKQPAENT